MLEIGLEQVVLDSFYLDSRFEGASSLRLSPLDEFLATPLLLVIVLVLLDTPTIRLSPGTRYLRRGGEVACAVASPTDEVEVEGDVPSSSSYTSSAERKDIGTLRLYICKRKTV